MPGNSVVWIFDPNDMEHLFLSESNLPQRRSHLGVGVLRKDRPNVYNTGGLLHTYVLVFFCLKCNIPFSISY